MSLGTPGRNLVLVAVALIALRVLAANAALSSDVTQTDGSFSADPYRWHQIATSSGRPYRDFEVEFPPVTLAAIELFDGGTFRGTLVRMMWFQLALDVAVAGIIAWGWRGRAAIAYLLLGLPLAIWPFVYFRLDLLSVALAIGAVALVRRGRPALGGVVLAVACFAKVWPLAIVPLLIVRRQYRALTSFALTGVGGLAAWVAWSGFDGPRQVLTFRGAKGWEVESVVGGVVHAFANTPADLEQGAVRVGVVPDWAAVLLTAFGIALVVAAWLAARRVSEDHRLDGVAPVAAISAVLIGATILSPQYVAWLLPFAAISLAADERAVGGVTAAVVVLTALEYQLFNQVVDRSGDGLAVLFIRNAMLLTLYGVAIRALLVAGRRRVGAATAATGSG